MRCEIFMRKRERTSTWSKRTGYNGSIENAKAHAERLLTQDYRQGDNEADRNEVLIVEMVSDGHGVTIERVATFEAHSGTISLGES